MRYASPVTGSVAVSDRWILRTRAPYFSAVGASA